VDGFCLKENDTHPNATLELKVAVLAVVVPAVTLSSSTTNRPLFVDMNADWLIRDVVLPGAVMVLLTVAEQPKTEITKSSAAVVVCVLVETVVAVVPA